MKTIVLAVLSLLFVVGCGEQQAKRHTVPVTPAEALTRYVYGLEVSYENKNRTDYRTTKVKCEVTSHNNLYVCTLWYTNSEQVFPCIKDYFFWKGTLPHDYAKWTSPWQCNEKPYPLEQVPDYQPSPAA